MRYLSVGDDCNLDRPGGSGRVAWDIALLMRDRGHEVGMVSIANEGASSATVREEEGIRILRYPKPALPGWHPQATRRCSRAAAVATRELFGNESWDVVHLHLLRSSAGVIEALGDRPRYVCTVHSPVGLELPIAWRRQGLLGRLKLLFGVRTMERLERRILERCSEIHTLSRFTRDQIDRFHGFGDRITVIPHWRRPELRRTHSREEARRMLGWPDDRPVFFTVRYHGYRQGIDVAIRALGPLCRERECRFVVAGDGPLRPSFEQLASDLGVRDCVEFVGRVSDRDLALAYEAADLFVLPTLALECFGLITIEAFAFGCPVLSTDAAAIPEIMNPIMPGFVVPAGDAAALRAKAEEFLDGKLAAPPPEELVRFAEQRYDRSVVTPKILRLLEG